MVVRRIWRCAKLSRRKGTLTGALFAALKGARAAAGGKATERRRGQHDAGLPCPALSGGERSRTGEGDAAAERGRRKHGSTSRHALVFLIQVVAVGVASKYCKRNSPVAVGHMVGGSAP
jgi:hypothetical protein